MPTRVCKLIEAKQLIEHVIERLSNQVDDIVISANEDQGQYQTFGYPVVADVESSQGPLTGIFSAAAHTKHDQVFITACDIPNLPTNIVSELLKSDSPVVMTRSNKGIEPLVSLVNREAIQNIEGYLASGQRQWRVGSSPVAQQNTTHPLWIPLLSST